MEKVSSEAIASATAYENFLVPALIQKWPSRVLDSVVLKRGYRILDIACGTGILAREALSRVIPGGSVTGIDPAPGMLEVAKKIDPSIKWIEAEAESLPFADETFDVAVSQFGMMFFKDRDKAIKEMLRTLVSVGQVAIAVWHDLEHSPAYKIEVDLLEKMAGREAADALRAPFVLGNKSELEKLFKDAGVKNIKIFTYNEPACFPDIRSMVGADLKGWLPIMGVVLPDDLIEKILSAAESALGKFVGQDGKVIFDSPAHIVTGTKS